MSCAALAILLTLLAPGEPDELASLEVVVRRAVERVSPGIVRIETVGGVRQVNLPPGMGDRMTVPERPRENDPDAPERREGEEEDPQEGRTPRFENEWEKMLALPGFKKAEGPTTGVVVSEEGHIVTSAWNFESRPTVITVVTADGVLRPARLLGVDRAAGLALLKVEESGGLRVPEFVDPGEVEVGAWAFALGRALDPDSVEVKYGIISAKNRVDGNALQTDAATSPSNYGGPLVDARGRVYGIIVPLGAGGEEANPNWYDSGIGFAVPVPDPARLVARLGTEGTVLEAAFLGVEMDQDSTEAGAKIRDVAPDSPAAKAGLQKDDLVVAVDGEPVRSAFGLRFAVGRRRAGDRATLRVRRGEDEIDLEVVLGARGAPAREPEKLPLPMPER